MWSKPWSYKEGLVIGAGLPFIIPIEDAIRIRTAERGDIALYNAEQER